MHEEVFVELLILMVVVWSRAVGLRYFGVPTVMGELIAGVILGPLACSQKPWDYTSF